MVVGVKDERHEGKQGSDLRYLLEVEGFLPAALAEAGLEIAFKVTDRLLVGEVETLVHLLHQIWRGR